jgi:hypothetical protein
VPCGWLNRGRALQRSLEAARATFGFGEQVLNVIGAPALTRELAVVLGLQARELAAAHAELEP